MGDQLTKFLEARLRTVCQTLVEISGADGPCNAEDAAERVKELVDRLTGQRESYIRRLESAKSERDEARQERDIFVASFLSVTGQKSGHDSIQSFLEGYRGTSMEAARKKVEGEG